VAQLGIVKAQQNFFRSLIVQNAVKQFIGFVASWACRRGKHWLHLTFKSWF